MSVVNGEYYDGTSSASVPAQLRVEGQRVIVTLESEDSQPPVTKVFLVSESQVSDRLAGIHRKITFPDQSCFETRDNDSVDKLFRTQDSLSGWLHFLESHKNAAMISVISLVAFCLLFYFVLLPGGAHYLAKATPQFIKDHIDSSFISTFKTLKVIDETQLRPERRQDMEKLFLSVKNEFPDLSLKFRLIGSGRFGANAFALPGGTIHVTDGLVNIAEDDNEILGVLYHEVGHVKFNHSMEGLIQRAGLSLLLFMIVGADDLTALPMLILTSAYSRDDEKESDLFAAERLKAKGLSPSLLGDILTRMSDKRGPRKEGETDLLQSHPLTRERQQYLKNYE